MKRTRFLLIQLQIHRWQKRLSRKQQQRSGKKIDRRYLVKAELDNFVWTTNIRAFLEKLKELGVYDENYFAYEGGEYVVYDHPEHGVYMAKFGSKILQWRKLTEADAFVHLLANWPEGVYINSAVTGSEGEWKKYQEKKSRAA